MCAELTSAPKSAGAAFPKYVQNLVTLPAGTLTSVRWAVGMEEWSAWKNLAQYSESRSSGDSGALFRSVPRAPTAALALSVKSDRPEIDLLSR